MRKKPACRSALGLDTMYGGIPLQMEFLVEAGIPPMDAIRAGTSVGAKLIGYGDKLGTIERGKWADMISVQGSPIENIRNTAADSGHHERRRAPRHAVVDVVPRNAPTRGRWVSGVAR